MKQVIFMVIFLLIVAVMGSLFFTLTPAKEATETVVESLSTATVTPEPTVEPPFTTYKAPDLPQKDAYVIVMVGDSMTHALGPHGGTFSEFMNQKYKPHGKGIVIDNYANPSTSILTINKAMNTKTTYWDATFEPLLAREFDLILIESFGYNPMSQFSLDVGLKRQKEILDETMKNLQKAQPEARVMFVATIAPNKYKYALPVDPDTTLEDRTGVVNERMTYIKNHIDYAKEHNIPIVNIFEKSLNAEGDGDLKYINPHDYVHPSALGVDFIGQEITDYIYENQIIPH